VARTDVGAGTAGHGRVARVDTRRPTAGEAGSGVNPFDDPDGEFMVLVNDEGQHSLWPSFADVPGGWHVAHDKDTREACVAHIEQNWTDMRPTSLIEAMGA
jgi:MbtH protein